MISIQMCYSLWESTLQAFLETSNLQFLAWIPMTGIMHSSITSSSVRLSQTGAVASRKGASAAPAKCVPAKASAAGIQSAKLPSQLRNHETEQLSTSSVATMATRQALSVHAAVAVRERHHNSAFRLQP
jgi:hypothetical protein